MLKGYRGIVPWVYYLLIRQNDELIIDKTWILLDPALEASWILIHICTPLPYNSSTLTIQGAMAAMATATPPAALAWRKHHRSFFRSNTSSRWATGQRLNAPWGMGPRRPPIPKHPKILQRERHHKDTSTSISIIIIIIIIIIISIIIIIISISNAPTWQTIPRSCYACCCKRCWSCCVKASSKFRRTCGHWSGHVHRTKKKNSSHLIFCPSQNLSVGLNPKGNWSEHIWTNPSAPGTNC